MIKLTIYGRLRKFVGESTFEIAAKSPREAFSFLHNNFNGVEEHMKYQEYCVMAGNIRISPELLDLRTENDIKIIPVVHGELDLFDIFKFAAGGLLFALGGGATIFGITITNTAVATAFTVVGSNLLISGVTDLLTPDPINPNLRRQEDPNDPSFSFTGLLNNSKQGVPINIAYGEILVGSTLVSSSVDTFQVVAEE